MENLLNNNFDAFVVTKPLQYINVLNIKNTNKKILLLVDVFVNSEEIFNKIKKISSYWDEVYFFKTMNETFNFIISNRFNISTLYIDSDINHRKEFSILRNLNLTVYEEGVGTYRRKQYKPKKRILGNLYLFYLKLRGYENRRGGNKYTKNIIVYFPDFYKKYLNVRRKNIIPFNKPFIEHLRNCKELSIFENNFDFTNLNDKIVVLFLPSWNINDKEVEIIKSISCDITILKPHPYTRQNVNQYEFNMIISGEIPAEILILRILDVASKLIIVSNYSTGTIYFQGQDKIKIINLEIPISEYNDTDSYVDAYNNLVNYIITN